MNNVTIQKTSKALKVQMIIYRLMAFISLVWAAWLFYGAWDRSYVDYAALLMPPAITLGVSVVWSVVIRFLVWWNHE